MNTFKLEPCDILVRETEGKGFIPSFLRCWIGPWGHVSMFIGDCTIAEGFDKVPLVFQSIGKGAGLYSLESMTGELVLVMRPLISPEQKQLVIANAIEIASCPKSYYDYRAEPEPAPGKLTELDKILGRKIQERQTRKVRPVITGPNMPRRQPCTCGRWGKRIRKTMDGAYYRCPIHGDFFVRAPRL